MLVIKHDKGTVVEWRNIAISAAVYAVLFALAFLLLRSAPRLKWVETQGTVQDTRIVADHAVETKWGGQLTWKAEYKVGYSVDNRAYATWVDSGIRGESEAAVRLAVPQSLPHCRVQYNSKRPEQSSTECR